MNGDLKRIVHAVLAEYALPPDGVHGVTHWARVLENGLRLAERTGASAEVVRLFAVFHDSRRENETLDPGHGLRGGELARQFRGELFELADAEFDLLFSACAAHTDGLTVGDVTVRTCWDADRLDLPRAGIVPEAGRLCTEAARDHKLRQWAHDRSCLAAIPEIVGNDWGFDVSRWRGGRE